MNIGCHSCETVYRVDPAKVPDGGIRARCTMCSEVMEVTSVGAEPKPHPAPTRATAAPVRAAPEPRPSPPPVPGQRRVTRPISAPPTPAPPPISSPAPEAPIRVEPERTTVPHRAAEREEPILIATPAAPVEQPQAPPAPERPSAPVFRPIPGPPMAAPPVPPVVEEPAPEPEAPAEPEPPAPAPEKKAPINPFLARDPRQKARRLARALVSDMIVYQPDKRQQALSAGNLKEAFEEEIQKSWQEYREQIGPELANSTTYFTDALNEILAGGQNLF